MLNSGNKASKKNLALQREIYGPMKPPGGAEIDEP
jgi:hypothetical protein